MLHSLVPMSQIQLTQCGVPLVIVVPWYREPGRGQLLGYHCNVFALLCIALSLLVVLGSATSIMYAYGSVQDWLVQHYKCTMHYNAYMLIYISQKIYISIYTKEIIKQVQIQIKPCKIILIKQISHP